MANEDREIRFIDPMYNEKFRIPDGGTIRVDYPDRSFTAKCEYIDDYHTSINNRVFHICEFAELMKRNGGVVRPEIGTFELYQLKDSPELLSRRFAPYKRLAKHGRSVSKSNYDQVYSGKLFAGETLDSIYERFNLHHPADFRGHSLSVSDVIVLYTNNQDQAFYVDSFGFKHNHS